MFLTAKFVSAFMVIHLWLNSQSPSSWCRTNDIPFKCMSCVWEGKKGLSKYPYNQEPFNAEVKIS